MIDKVPVARDEREVRVVGRRARLELRFGVRDGRTALVASYAEPPFRVGRTFAESDGVHMIMVSAAPGIFGGDAFEQLIHVESGARVRLTSQSALQVHPSADGRTATLRSRYIVDEGGELECFWDPVIPFAASRLDQRVEISLAAGARLCWSDAFMTGREARGERWQFDSLKHELRLTRERVLEYLERYDIEPRHNSESGAGPQACERGAGLQACLPTERWCANDASYFGSTLVSHPAATGASAETMHHDLRQFGGITAACDLIEPELLLVRLMASSGPGFHAARQRVADLVLDRFIADVKAASGQRAELYKLRLEPLVRQ